MSDPRTLFEKVWDDHVVRQPEGEPALLYIDLHLVHEVTSPQAFDSIRLSGRAVRRPDLTVSTIDHGVPTTGREFGIKDPMSKRQIETLIANCEQFGIRLYGLGDPRQGIVHVIGPEQGVTQPGMTIVCGDSHTATHGAFGSLAFGIGTSEVEHVLATQTLPQQKPKSMAITVDGELPPGVTAKDIILGIIARIGTAGATGHVIEYRGSAIESLSMEGRMTICNMSIEGGARAGMIAPDETTFAYLEGRPEAPKGAEWAAAVEYWRTLPTDEGATFDEELFIDASELEPYVSWGTNPGQTLPISGTVPSPDQFEDPIDRDSAIRALEYMDLTPGTPLTEIAIDRVFFGSCTNARIEDLRAAARDRERQEGRFHRFGHGRSRFGPGETPGRGRGSRHHLHRSGLRVARCRMLHVPGDEPRHPRPGRTMRLHLEPQLRGPPGAGGRTHLLSPQMAAAAAIAGHLVDVREVL